jgi:outer membrane protein OmpA-like peptidoglycan-associated protein
MKKLFLIIIVFAFTVSSTNAQVSKDGWALGLDFVSPRLFSDIGNENIDYGGRFIIQKNLSERAAMRFSLDYLMFTGQNIAPAPIKFSNNTMKFGIGAVYNFLPCEVFSPFVGIGGGILYYTLKNSASVKDDSYFGELTADFYFGGTYNFAEDWFLKVELSQNTVSTDKLDGIKGGQGGLFGGTLDSYTSLGIGLLYYIDRGTTSTYCDDLAKGISANIDYAKIEEIVRKYTTTPTDVDYNKIEDIVKKHAGKTTVQHTDGDKNWVLIGVNFDFAKSTLSPESYPILSDAAKVLMGNPSMKVEIQGHTDNIGSANSNQKLSIARAETVKSFLLSKGVEASRLSTAGFGDTKPISDNKTAQGRSFNRRIEFKILK